MLLFFKEDSYLQVQSIMFSNWISQLIIRNWSFYFIALSLTLFYRYVIIDNTVATHWTGWMFLNESICWCTCSHKLHKQSSTFNLTLPFQRNVNRSKSNKNALKLFIVLHLCAHFRRFVGTKTCHKYLKWKISMYNTCYYSCANQSTTKKKRENTKRCVWMWYSKEYCRKKQEEEKTERIREKSFEQFCSLWTWMTHFVIFLCFCYDKQNER